MIQMEKMINLTLQKHPNLRQVFSIYPAFRHRSLERQNYSRNLKISFKEKNKNHSAVMQLIHNPQKLIQKQTLQKIQQKIKQHSTDNHDLCIKQLNSQFAQKQQNNKAVSYLGIHFPQKLRQIKRAHTELGERKQLKSQLSYSRKWQKKSIIFKLPKISQFRRNLKAINNKKTAEKQQIKPVIDFKLIQALSLSKQIQMQIQCQKIPKKYSLNKLALIKSNKNTKKSYISGWTIKQFQ